MAMMNLLNESVDIIRSKLGLVSQDNITRLMASHRCPAGSALLSFRHQRMIVLPTRRD
jgi:hypothetical protein